MTIVDAIMIMNNAAGIVNNNCTDNMSITNDSYIWYNDQYK